MSGGGGLLEHRTHGWFVSVGRTIQEVMDRAIAVARGRHNN